MLSSSVFLSNDELVIPTWSFPGVSDWLLTNPDIASTFTAIDVSGNGNNATDNTNTLTFTPDILNGLGGTNSDGGNTFLSFNSAVALTGDFIIYWIGVPNGVLLLDAM